WAQPPSSTSSSSSEAPSTSSPGDQQPSNQYDLPVSLDRIKEALEQSPKLSLQTVDQRPTFRVEILERQKIDELLASLDFKTTRAPAGGLYWGEVQRQMWPSVDNPLRQPYAAFSQSELLTIVIENLVGQYLGSKAFAALTNAERARAEAAAREEVHR